MPDTEPWTPNELSRAIRTVTATLERIEGKIDSRPTREEITRSEAIQLRKDTEQDEAIKALEDQYTRLLFTAAAGALTGAGGLVTALLIR